MNTAASAFTRPYAQALRPGPATPAARAANTSLPHELPPADQDALHADAGADEPAQQESPVSAPDYLRGVKAWYDERESARNHWLMTIAAANETQRGDVDVASAFVKQHLMGTPEVSASAIWSWMDKLPGFTDLTPGQQDAVRLLAAFKMEDGSCWKTAAQIEAYEASLVAQPDSRLELREQLLKKLRPVLDACFELYSRACEKHAGNHEFIRSLRQAWEMRQESTLNLIRQIDADRKKVEQAATAPDESSAIAATPAEALQALRARQLKLGTLLDKALTDLRMAQRTLPLDLALLAQRQRVATMYKEALRATRSNISEELEAPPADAALAAFERRVAADAQRLADLQCHRDAQLQTLLGVHARIEEARRGMSARDTASLDSFTETMVRASKQDFVVWSRIEGLRGFANLTGPVKKAAQLLAQSKICIGDLRSIEAEIASVTSLLESKG